MNLARRGQRVSEARVRSAIERSPIGVHVFAPDGRALLSNTAWKEMWGAPREGEVDEVGGVFRDERVRASGLLPYLEEGAAGATVAATPPLVNYPSGYPSRGGERWFEASIYPVKAEGGRVLEVVLVAEDVTERQRARADLEDSEERSRSLTQNASDLTLVLDADGRIRYASPSSERVLGRRPDLLVGEDLFDYVHLEDLGVVGPAFTGNLGKPGATGDRVEYRMSHTDGTYRSLEGVATNLMDTPSVGGIVVNARDVTERKALEDLISRQAFHDHMTGLPNRALFLDRVEIALARLTRQKNPFAVLLMDLDNFRVVNDSMGSETGDAVLFAFAERIKEHLRPQDTLARFGEDEFAVLLEGLDDLGGAVRVAERISRALIETPFVVGGRDLFLGASIGIALGARSLEEPREVLRRSDLALRGAKKRGKGRYEIFDESMDADVLARLRLEDELRAAIPRGEIVVHYEPTVSIVNERTFSMEALARWEHPERGLLQAGEFMSVAEETGLVIPIGEMVLLEACRQGVAWQERYPARVAPRVSMNVSRRQILQPDFVEKVIQALQQTGLRPRGLALEISEGVLANDEEEISSSLRALKDFGVNVTVDNFGMGHSPLSRLKRFPADTLKVDRSMTIGIEKDIEDRALVAAVVSLARALGRSVVACGVETVEQFERLRELGCDLAQGNYFSLALPPEVATSLLDSELLGLPNLKP